MIKSSNLIRLCQPPLSNTVNLIQTRNTFYNRYRHGPQKISNPTPDYLQWVKDFFGREGLEFIKGEANRIARKTLRGNIVRFPEKNITEKFEDFDSQESIKRWKVVLDSDSLNGFSVAKIIRSPSGHALFTGVLDCRVPDDGITQDSGFAGITGPQKPRDTLLGVDEYWDWSMYNSLEIRFRGDGRKYNIVLNTSSSHDDLSYYDNQSYPLYTRGGPYWQTTLIPFSKFVFCYKSIIQDRQGYLPVHNIKFVAVTLQDSYSGPFSLEIDYIGLRNHTLPFDEETPYETYTFPHIRYRSIQVECAPPDPLANS